ncbi:MAG: 50S ribosomal protein L1 [Euryarchaeota archaeon]|nr:50S ribosomal protein L1 [Euryarchaeota archaeon]
MPKEERNLGDAVRRALEKAPGRKFAEGVDLAIHLQNVDMAKTANRVDEEVVLPHGTGKEPRVAVFAKGEVALRAQKAGTAVISPDEIPRFGKDKKEGRRLVQKYDAFVAESHIMALIGKNLGPILGPRNMMPIPLPPDGNIDNVLTRMKKTVRIRSKDKMAFHVKVGRRSMKPEEVIENTEVVLKRLEGRLERGAQNIKSVYIKTSMGPPVRLL